MNVNDVGIHSLSIKNYIFIVSGFFSEPIYIDLLILWLQKKIDKRGRKLVDYDGQRHSFQGLQANAAKRRDDVKVNIIYNLSKINQLKRWMFSYT